MFALVVVLRVQIKMADVILTIKLMPESPEINLEDLEIKVKSEIKKFYLLKSSCYVQYYI